MYRQLVVVSHYLKVYSKLTQPSFKEKKGHRVVTITQNLRKIDSDHIHLFPIIVVNPKMRNILIALVTKILF
jgi:hypothetical protein